MRFVRALGQHRYVAGRLHLVHAFVFDAAREAGPAPALEEAIAWSARVLADPDVDPASRDERLFRRATDAELSAALSVFWTPGGARDAACLRLAERLEAIGVEPPSPSVLPFDESAEDDVYPVLIDAGWELLPLASLDPERHKGAIAAFDDFEVARFEEENAVPPRTPLHELPLLGALELLAAFDERGLSRAAFVLWASGHEVYLDYVLRGVMRAARLSE